MPQTTEQMRRYRSKHRDTENAARRKRRKSATETKRAEREKYVAVLDFETDPFDSVARTPIYPFVCCIYSDNFEPIIIWNNDHNALLAAVVCAIKSLPNNYIIYAHNGGKFDWMFLMKQMHGKIMFKGRGILSAYIGPHELRDSFHIIPEKLASIQKDAFDYSKMHRSKRQHHRAEIETYLLHDCQYLFSIVRAFIREFGLKLTIGQAAITTLKQSYNVQRITEDQDVALRPFLLGGRVECMHSGGFFRGTYHHYDVNSMYAFAMASYPHPIGNAYTTRRGAVEQHTCFINLNCRNRGAFLSHLDDGTCTANVEYGNFLVTVHEYRIALQYNLISDVQIHWCIDCDSFSDFSSFVHPLYDRRQQTKALLKTMDASNPSYYPTKRDDLFLKLLLNNAYGKFAQNPRRFKERLILHPTEIPFSDGFDCLPAVQTPEYCIWEREAKPWRFFNVGTGASITGAARSYLLSALCNSVDPIYCDTDSIICRELRDVPISSTQLGAWKHEASYDEIVIAGKKLYAARFFDDRTNDWCYTVKSKGAYQPSTERGWYDMLSLLFADTPSYTLTNKAPTISKYGDQTYITREIRSTAPLEPGQLYRILEQCQTFSCPHPT